MGGSSALVAEHPADTDAAYVESVLVRAKSADEAADHVRRVGGSVTHHLSIIHAVGADLTRKQQQELKKIPGVKLSANRSLRTKSGSGLVIRRLAVSLGHDDATENLTTGSVLVDQPHLTLGRDDNDSEHLSGFRFQGLDVPPGAKVTRAVLELESAGIFHSHAELEIRAEASGNAPAFSSAARNLSNRASTQAKADWTINLFMEAGRRVHSTDLSNVVQEVIDREDWNSGHSLVLLVNNQDYGERRVRSFEDHPSESAALLLEYQLPGEHHPVAEATVERSNDDAEERLDNGVVILNSGDLDAGDQDEETTGVLSGLRFVDLEVPQGATITGAYIEFFAHERGNEPTSLQLHAEAIDDAHAFSSLDHDISRRTLTLEAAHWSPPAFNHRGQSRTTSDLSHVVQEIVDRPGWTAGNDITFVISGQGSRKLRTIEGGSSRNSRLRVAYEGGPVAQPPSTPPSAPATCSGTTGPSGLFIIDVHQSGVNSLTVEVAGGLPQAPLSVAGREIGCLNDQGAWYGTLYDTQAEACTTTISDGSASLEVNVANCVDWKATDFPSYVGADRLHERGVTGHGVTIAFVDTGIQGRLDWGDNAYRMLAHYDSQQDRELHFWVQNADANGHGSHVASIAASRGKTNDGKSNGVAPDANLVMVRSFDEHGRGSYADVIRGIQWVVDNKNRLGVRVLNLSFSAPAVSHYWEDPLNLAVMEAWRAGIVVVVSAGNEGPSPMTVGVPGNLPYVITVGALTDAYTPADKTDDRLASFSAAGPTFEGFVKPEVVAPGGHMLGLMAVDSYLAEAHPEFHSGPVGMPYFTMSGTSQAAAVVSGAAALLLQDDPTLTPDTVKCRLMRTAKAATDDQGQLPYSILQQGTGVIDVHAASLSTHTGCANRGLDIDDDITGQSHFLGPVRQTDEGDFYLEGTDGFLWNVSDASPDGFLWNVGFLWNNSIAPDGFLWNVGFLWNTNTTEADGFLWNVGFLWNNSDFSGSEIMSINTWAPQE